MSVSIQLSNYVSTILNKTDLRHNIKIYANIILLALEQFP